MASDELQAARAYTQRSLLGANDRGGEVDEELPLERDLRVGERRIAQAIE